MFYRSWAYLFVGYISLISYDVRYLLAPVNLKNQLPPEVVLAAQPPYPSIAVAQRVEGIVLIDVSIREDGKVIDADVVSGPTSLIKVTKEASLKWRFDIVAPDSGTRSARLTFRFCIPQKSKCPESRGFSRPYSVLVKWEPIHDEFK